MMKVRKGGGEEIPLVQGKEQWLRFAGLDITDPFEYLFLYCDTRNCATFHSMDCF